MLVDVGLQITGCACFVKGDSRWCNLPARQQLDQNGEPRIGPDGKIVYISELAWANSRRRAAFSNALIDALTAAGIHLDE